jgi:peptidoglycan hydrolase-like protein with peptidoglycan-binding domain
LPGYLFSQTTGQPCGSSSTLPPIYVQPGTFTRDLSFGSIGDDVTALQNILIAQGYLAAGLNIGIFGSRTTAALAAFQQAHGISPALGYFGPITRGVITSSGTTGGGTTLPPTTPP